MVKFRLIDFRSRAGGEPSLIARPMLRWILFSLTLLTTVIALFTVVNWPSIPGWLLALASAELGHFLALLTVALLVAAFTVGSVGPLRWPVLGLGLVSLVLLLRPAWLASQLAGELPGKLQSDFGPAASARAAFSWMRLFVPATTPSTPCAVWTSTSRPAASPRSWARAAPASPPSCTAWPASTPRPPAR